MWGMIGRVEAQLKPMAAITSVVSVPGGSAMIFPDKSQRTNKNNAVFFPFVFLFFGKT